MSDLEPARALIIAHEPEGVAGLIEQRLVERGFVVDTHVVTHDHAEPNVSVPFPDFAAYDVVVPMGSVRSLTNTDEISSWIHDEIDAVRAAHERGQPILGVCFGGQLISVALGGSVETAPSAEIGWFEVGDGDVPNPVGPGPWMEWHHDRMVPPPGAEVLARNDEAAQLIRMGRTVGTQFHPEVDAAHISTFLDATGDDYLAANGVTRDEILGATRRNEAHNAVQCAALVDWYLDEVAFPDGPTRIGSGGGGDHVDA